MAEELMEKIKEVLTQVWLGGNNCPRNVEDIIEFKERDIDQALTQILELLEKCVPEKRGRKIYFGEDCTSDKIKGYNQALAEIKRRIK